MNAVCVYASKTGHCRKIARAIGRELGLPVYDVKDRPVLADVNLLLLVGGIYAGQCASELIRCAGALDPSQARSAALITSSTEPNRRLDAVREALTGRGVALAGEHWCKGGFLLMAPGRPNREDIAGAVAFTRELVER